MFSHTAYNLRIRSALHLPELPTGEGGVSDVTVCFGSVDRTALDTAKEGVVFASAKEVCLSFSKVATFLIREGREIVIDPVQGVDERWIRIGVLGPSMGALMYQRGWLTLHASSVAVDDEAIAFVGERGWGKSTIAAAMCARGHSFVADDITPVKVDGAGRVIACPGYPQLKLWPDAAASLGEDPDELPRLDPLSQRRARPSTHNFWSEPLPLRRVYVLGGGEKSGIEPLQPKEALVELIRYTYGRELIQVVGTRSHFLKCVSVANNVALCGLKRPYSLASLSDLVRLVEEDLLVDLAVPG